MQSNGLGPGKVGEFNAIPGSCARTDFRLGAPAVLFTPATLFTRQLRPAKCIKFLPSGSQFRNLNCLRPLFGYTEFGANGVHAQSHDSV